MVQPKNEMLGGGTVSPYAPYLDNSSRPDPGPGPGRLWPSRRWSRRTVLGWAITGGAWGVVGRRLGKPWGGSGPVPGSPRQLVRKMSLDEKIGRLHGVIRGPYVGYVPGLKRLRIPALTLVDGPAGIRFGGPQTAMPAPIVLAATFDPDRARSYATAIAAEARASGNNVLFGPGMNMARVWQGGRNFEYFGEDPQLTSAMAAAYIRAVQDAGLIAVAKHLICNDQEDNRHAVSVEVSDRALHEIYLPPFLAAVAAGAGAVMAANNRLRGTYCSQNSPLLEKLLKQGASFPGFVVSDYSATHDAIAAARNGLDLDMPDASHFGAPLRAAVKSGDSPGSDGERQGRPDPELDECRRAARSSSAGTSHRCSYGRA